MGLCLSKPIDERKYHAPVAGGDVTAIVDNKKAVAPPSPSVAKDAEQPEKHAPASDNTSPAPPPTDLIGNLIDPVTGAL